MSTVANAGEGVALRIRKALLAAKPIYCEAAILLVCTALGVSLVFQHFGFRDAAVPLLLFASAATSWYGGPIPSILATILSVVGFDFFFVPPIYSLNVQVSDLPYFMIFVAFTTLISWFATVRRRVEENLRQAEHDLRLEVQERSRLLNVTRGLNRELTQRSTALEASNKELEAFAYSISHDLRAPLRHVAGFAELLRKNAGESLSEKNRRYVVTIIEAANRMGSLIDDLLSFSRISRAEAHNSVFTFEQLVHDVVAEVQRDAGDRKITWNIESLPEWFGDRSMLRLALVNLISNAVKFTRKRPQAEIQIGCKKHNDDEIVLFVHDNGVGFDMKYSNKLFGVFQRLHTQEAFEGTGIGLATVQRIVHRHGGHVWAEGKADAGATFYFSLSKKL